MEVLPNATVVIISQYISVSNEKIVQLKLKDIYVSYMSIYWKNQMQQKIKINDSGASGWLSWVSI